MGVCTWKRGGILNNMRKIKVDPLDGGIFRDDEVKCSSDTATDINQSGDAFESPIGGKDLLHGNGGVVRHAAVENLVESGVGAMVLERRHSIRLVEGYSPIKNCIFQVIPT